MSTQRPSKRLASRARKRGAVLVEYAFLLVAFGIPTMIGLSLGGVKMLKNYEEARTAMLRSGP